VLASGDLLDDRYRLHDRIAAGGIGEVWEATDTVLGRTVAVKVLQPRHGGDPDFQLRFRHEARAMAALRHPAIADVYDYGESGDDRYIVMAHIEGQPLDQRIAEAGRLDTATTVSIVAQAARALDAAHAAGIIHRDVKPANLIVRPDSTVVLVDFGVARSADSTALTGVNEVVGTALYIAPEQVSKQASGPATDIYALGVVAYHCLAGHPPFLGDNPIQIAMQHLRVDPPPLPSDVPEPVRDLVTTALKKDPADRFPTAAAMADAADALAAHLGRGISATGGGTDGAGLGAGVHLQVAGASAGLRTARSGFRRPDAGRRSRGALITAALLLLTVPVVVVLLALAASGSRSPRPSLPPGPAASNGASQGAGAVPSPGAPGAPQRSGQPSGTAGSNPAGGGAAGSGGAGNGGAGGNPGAGASPTAPAQPGNTATPATSSTGNTAQVPTPGPSGKLDP
jgi:serine/threonine-protein kinase